MVSVIESSDSLSDGVKEAVDDIDVKVDVIDVVVTANDEETFKGE